MDIPSVLKLAGAAKQIGLRAVGAVDGDTSANIRGHLDKYGELPDAIVRLPDDIAIEAAIVCCIPDEVLKQTIREIAAATELAESHNFTRLLQLNDTRLTKSAISFIKKNSLHGLFIDALPSENLPTLAVQYLEKLVEVATGTQTGLIQI